MNEYLILATMGTAVAFLMSVRGLEALIIELDKKPYLRIYFYAYSIWATVVMIVLATSIGHFFLLNLVYSAPSLIALYIQIKKIQKRKQA